MADQFGEEVLGTLMCMSSKWFACVLVMCGLITGCYCCCCCLCCCCGCCGKCAKDLPDDDIPDIGDLEEDDEENVDTASVPVTEQPGAPSGGAMPMPPPAAAKIPSEQTPLNKEEGPPPPSYESVFGDGDKSKS
jgi:DnaJ family protein C protein 5